MPRRYSVNFALFSILLDTISILLALLLAGFMHSWLEMIFPFIKQGGVHKIPFVFYIIFPTIWILLNVAFSLYNGRRNLRFYKEVLRLILGVLFAAASMAGILFFAYPDVGHSIYMSFIITASMMMCTWRVVIRLHWRYLISHKLDLRRVLVIGTGDVGMRVAEVITGPIYKNFQLVGFIDENNEKLTPEQNYLGTITDLESVVSSHSINIIVISLPSNSYGITANIVERLRLSPVNIWIVPAANQLARYHSDIKYLADIPTVDIRAPAISDDQRLIKRLFDLIFSTAAIFFSAPIMLICALLIKLDSPGPVFFRQKRVGENMQPFEMIKFRTMVQNAETLSSIVQTKDEQGNILHKHSDDPRITRIGRYLRRYSVDELPQFINVLRGNMSIVGPRPELPYLVEKYKSWQYVRFTIPQGITGWWQVSGRSNKPMHLNTDNDFYYINNYSFWLDIKIILKTISAVISGIGAF